MYIVDYGEWAGKERMLRGEEDGRTLHTYI
jgi:hypothetical protein